MFSNNIISKVSQQRL